MIPCVRESRNATPAKPTSSLQTRYQVGVVLVHLIEPACPHSFTKPVFGFLQLFLPQLVAQLTISNMRTTSMTSCQKCVSASKPQLPLFLDRSSRTRRKGGSPHKSQNTWPTPTSSSCWRSPHGQAPCCTTLTTLLLTACLKTAEKRPGGNLFSSMKARNLNRSLLDLSQLECSYQAQMLTIRPGK